MLSPKCLFGAALLLTIASAVSAQTTCMRKGMEPTCFLSTGKPTKAPRLSSSTELTTSTSAKPPPSSSSSTSTVSTSSTSSPTTISSTLSTTLTTSTSSSSPTSSLSTSSTSSTRTTSPSSSSFTTSTSSTTSTTRSSSSTTRSSSSTTSTSAAPTGPAVVQSAGSFAYIGCYADSQANRALSDSSASNSTGMTVEYCANYCVGSNYFGVEYAQECWCGNTLNSALASGSTPAANGCSMVCKGNSNEYCGGSARLNVYQNQAASTSTSSVSNAATGIPTANTGKRGLAYNNASYTQFYSLSGQGSKVSWAYNYYSAISLKGQNVTTYNNALRFIPILWSTATSLTDVWNDNANAALAAGADSLLSFNEPDGCGGGGSCIPLNNAVSGYQTYMNPFAGKTRLGGPAVTNGGAPSGLTYLSNFLGNCTGCTIDFIPIHWYSDASNVNYFKSYVEQAYVVGGYRPLWITEFGCSSGTDAQIQNFLKIVLPWLDATPYVERYAYFGDFQGILVNSDGTGLNALGQIFNNF